jgi:hypothetical protein
VDPTEDVGLKCPSWIRKRSRYKRLRGKMNNAIWLHAFNDSCNPVAIKNVGRMQTEGMFEVFDVGDLSGIKNCTMHFHSWSGKQELGKMAPHKPIYSRDKNSHQ